jgi:hypothetical protein
VQIIFNFFIGTGDEQHEAVHGHECQDRANSPKKRKSKRNDGRVCRAGSSHVNSSAYKKNHLLKKILLKMAEFVELVRPTYTAGPLNKNDCYMCPHPSRSILLSCVVVLAYTAIMCPNTIILCTYIHT